MSYLTGVKQAQFVREVCPAIYAGMSPEQVAESVYKSVKPFVTTKDDSYWLGFIDGMNHLEKNAEFVIRSDISSNH